MLVRLKKMNWGENVNTCEKNDKEITISLSRWKKRRPYWSGSNEYTSCAALSFVTLQVNGGKAANSPA